MTPLVSVRDLSVSFGAPVVSGVSFDIEPGQCVAIVGESGSGKSVTARALLGLTGGAVTASTLRFDTTDIADASRRQLQRLRGRHIGFISQGALVALDPLRPVGREIADPLRLHTSLSPAERQARMLELLAQVGMPNPALRASQRADELSGGLRQRAVIASAIALQPRLIIADEPTTALDTTVQAGILELLERLRQEGAAVLLISHDLAVVSRLASQVLVMSEGRVVESGPTHSVLSAPQHPYTRRLIAAVPAGRPRFSRLTEEPPALETPVEPAIVLAAQGLSRRFDTLQAVDGVSFSLRRGRTLGIVGESGSGKTTLARLVLALEPPDAGQVSLLGEPWSGVPESARRARRPRIGAIYQDAVSSFDPRWTVGRILADALGDKEGVPALLESVGLSAALAARRPRHLSGGQQQRVAIARAIAPRPDILICDEPVSSLDVSVQAQVLDLLDDLQRSLGLSYLFITHDLGVVRHMSDDVLVMRHGRIVEAGATEAVFRAPQDDYTKELLASAPRLPTAD
ncbi:ABC transporter ATP-binding protein [Glaciihabitans sp. INWT7]|uniref:dipeptide ABC transporter ATP-binding protein n=1 Tax=Glaciihabitans sp. INWT7 TaxID=2596912 RepID=UPI001625B1D0|nr:ABC transporter ATP-binding protein [Glaciihabitans sp. INWT7]QNE47161.1 ABC transporter ATP-binding protein [Glaciihabitans sp. INWT7]